MTKTTVSGRAAEETARARAAFPRGLEQPPETFRFALDALLLTSFLRPPSGAAGLPRLLDLGCGCGVVALGMLLRWPGLSALGVDNRADLVEAAGRNAARLGLAERFTALWGDVRDPAAWKAASCGEAGALAEGSCDLALANPPFFLSGSGREPQSEARRAALFGPPGTLRSFCEAASRFLRPAGRLGIVFPARDQPRLSAALAAAAFAPVRALPVLSRAGQTPRLLLVEAEKKDGPAPSRRLSGDPSGNGPPARHALAPLLSPPLVLHEGKGYSRAALAFCPWLETSIRHE